MENINDNLTQEQEQGINSQDVTQNGVIDVEVLETQPTDVPEQPVGTSASSSVLSLAEQALKIRAQEKADAEKARLEAQRLAKESAEQESLVRTLSGEVLGQAEAETEAFKEAGIGKKQVEIDALDEAILNASTSLAQQEVNDTLSVQKLAGTGRGVPASIVRGRQALLEQQLKAKRDSRSIELANTIATSNLLQGKVDSAKEAIEHAIELKFADKERELEIEIGWLERTESKQAAEKQKELDEIQRQKDEATEVFNIASLAAQQGAGRGELSAINNAKTKSEALAAANSLGADSRLNRYKTSLEINKIKAETAAEQAKLDGIKYNPDSEYKVGTPENVVAWMSKSASSDTNITPGQQEAITQGLRALDSVENLNQILFEGNDPLSTGRTAGAWRKMQAKVNEDISTKEMEALIIGLIPTAARGLFGEVGVLTDTDVDRYKQLVANSNNTQEENAAIQSILMDVAVNSVGVTLETAARSNQNVSGFTGRYIDTIDRVETQKELIGTAKINQLSNEELIKNTSKDYQVPENVSNAAQGGLDFINSVTQ